MARLLVVVMVVVGFAWMLLGVLGLGLLVGSSPVGGRGDNALVCRYLIGTTVQERIAYGLEPSCPVLPPG